MRAIVTGGAGFIGSHLASRLLDEGWSVTVVDDLSSGYERNVPSGAELLRLDVGDERAGDRLPADGADVVFHLASHVGQELSFEQPFHDLRANAFGTMVLLDWCLRAGVERLVFASSMNVYGDPDDRDRPVTEETPVRPPSPYAVGKIASEYLCKVYEPFGVRSTHLRLFNVFGPRQDMQNLKQGMVSIFMSYVARGEPILVRGSLDRFRDFVSVHDVVDAFVRCADDRAAGKVYNVSSGKRTSVRELLDEIVRAFDGDPDDYPVVHGDPTPRDQFGIFGDSTALRRDLGWDPQTGFREGIAEMARWVRESAEL